MPATKTCILYEYCTGSGIHLNILLVRVYSVKTHTRSTITIPTGYFVGKHYISSGSARSGLSSITPSQQITHFHSLKAPPYNSLPKLLFGQFQLVDTSPNLVSGQLQLVDSLRVQLPGQFQLMDNRRNQLSGQFQFYSPNLFPFWPLIITPLFQGPKLSRFTYA